MPEIKVFGIVEEDAVNFNDGFAMTVFCQGCTHPKGTPFMDACGHCIGCHNPDTHSLDGGTVYTTEQLYQLLHLNPLHKALVLSGGEPMVQAEALVPLCARAKEAGYKVWMYTGYTWEQLQTVRGWHDIAPYIDVLIDGPFIGSLKSHRLKFRGSKNQRMLNVQQSLARGKPVLYRKPSA